MSNWKQKGIVKALAYLLVGAMALGGCGTGGGRDGASSGESQSVAVSGSNASDSGVNDDGANSGSNVEEGQLPDVASLAAGVNQLVTDFGATNDTFSGETLKATNFTPRIGGLLPAIEKVEAEELSSDEVAAMDRAMRAYTKSMSEDLIINDAIEYYFYDQLTPQQQDFYDAFYMLGLDPTTTDNVVTLQTSQDPNKEEFWLDNYYVALLALNYDHPEMWWMHYSNGSITHDAGWNKTANGKYTLYLFFTKTYDADQLEKDLKAFNASVEAFLDDIDLDASEEEQALQVHDKLLKMATYDYDVMYKEGGDFAHTAFGPLVSNTAGTPHYCVCDGYAEAYCYILQQLGITATVASGMAGGEGADGGMGGHAWSLVLLNDKWYEVDACWDDSYADLEEMVEQNLSPDTFDYKYYMEMAKDQVYMNKLTHYMYRLTSAQIENYKAPNSLIYTTKDGKYRLQMIGDSKRQRYCDYEEMKDSAQGKLTALLPVADGKLYTGGKGNDGSTGGGNGGSSDGKDDEGGFDVFDYAKSGYAKIAGTYYISQFNNYPEAVLKKYYGDDYYKQLCTFELKADGTGTIYEDGSSLDFTFYFDGETLYLFAANGGSLSLDYKDGKFVLNDGYGNTYTFSKM